MKIATLETIHELLKAEVRILKTDVDYAQGKRNERYKELSDMVKADCDINREDETYCRWSECYDQSKKKLEEASDALYEFEHTDF